MKKAILTLRSVRRELNIALVISLVLVGCIEFWWRHCPPAFGWEDASRFADVMTNLLLAYIASWIFFIVRDHWEQTRTARTIRPSIEGRLIVICYHFKRVLEHLIVTSRESNRTNVILANLSQNEWTAYAEQLMWTSDGQRPEHSFFIDLNIRWARFGSDISEPLNELYRDFNTHDPRLTAALDRLRGLTKGIEDSMSQLNIEYRLSRNQKDFNSRSTVNELWPQIWASKVSQTISVMAELIKYILPSEVPFNQEILTTCERLLYEENPAVEFYKRVL